MKTQAEIETKLELLRESQDWPTATELIEWVLAPSPVVHEGADKQRCDHSVDGWVNRERIFAEKWRETNNPPHFVNSGIGTLEWLVCTRYRKGANAWRPELVEAEFYRHLTQEEATAAASVVQWLGTNCGWCWLEECIRECGFDIVQRREPKK